MRVAFLTPFASPSVRGNAVTVDRIARGLAERGVRVRVWDLSVLPRAVIEADVEEFGPTLVHAFHAYRAGPLALRLARRTETPLVVTVTGTDVNHDLFDPDRAATVRRVLEGASAIAAFHESIGRRIGGALPDIAGRIAVIPQSVALPREPFDLASRWALPAERVLFVFPAGVRPVKRPRFPLEPLGRVVARRPWVRLLYVGPILDPDEGDGLRRALAPRPWARYLGTIPHAQMWSVLQTADVVINASQSEGGMANSVLEAMAAGRAVLASDIEGNRSLVDNGRTGLLFRSPVEFEGAAERLVDDEHLRHALGEAARSRLAAFATPEREIDDYWGLYEGLPAVLRRAPSGDVGCPS